MDASPFGELLAVTHDQTLEFFASGLKDVLEVPVRKREFLYSASILAHYAQVPCGEEGEAQDVPCPRTLVDVFNFELERVTVGDNVSDSNTFEVKACQTLLFCGFFRRQMARRHNLSWYESIGSMYFKQAAIRLNGGNKAELLACMSSSFPFWSDRFHRLERDLRDRPYLVGLPTEGGLQ